MCPEARASKPGPCPKCGMALEPTIQLAATRTEYTCPMHPQIVRPGPGFCPICGMALEPRTVTATEEENPELRDMTRRFWISLILTIPLLTIAMVDMLPGMPIEHALPAGWLPWIELLKRGHACCPLGRQAFLSARVGVYCPSLNQHVHADRHGYGGGLPF